MNMPETALGLSPVGTVYACICVRVCVCVCLGPFVGSGFLCC